MPQIDMRRELVRFLNGDLRRNTKGHGHWGVLRSVRTDGLPHALDSQTGQPREQPSGHGEGKAYVDYLVKLDRRNVVPGLNVDTAIGDAVVGVEYFFVEYRENIKRDDLILEVELDETTRRPITPFRIRATYKVIKAEDMRDEEGRVEFYACRVEMVGAAV